MTLMALRKFSFSKSYSTSRSISPGYWKTSEEGTDIVRLEIGVRFARAINHLNNLPWIVLDSLSREVFKSKLDAFSKNKINFTQKLCVW